MMFYLILIGLLLGIVLYVLYYFTRRLIPLMYFGAIFIPSSDARITTMLELAQISPGMRIADVGSGDGKILIAAAQHGAHATGIEIDATLIARSRKNIRRAKLTKHVHVLHKDMWKIHLSTYDVIFIYGMPYMMKRFSKKIRSEAKKTARVVSNCNRIPGLTLIQEKDGVYSYSTN